MRRALLFLFLWLMIGFSTGSSTLLGPVRWVTSYGRRAGWEPGSEDRAVTAIIFLFVCGSAAIAALLTRTVLRSSRSDVRAIVPALATVAAAGALWLWMSPEYLIADTGEEVVEGAHFTFGPYPDEKRLGRLRKEGYTAVIPLLHPAVVPFEPKLLAKEREAAEKVGIEVIHIPMLPWISDNTESLEKILTLARSGEGRYYVHCYLGRDRVQSVKRLVEKSINSASVESLTRARGLDQVGSFERGDVYRLDERTFLTPYPTDEEFMAYFVTGVVDRVVSLLDPDRPGHQRWLEKERQVLSQYKVPLMILPVRSEPYDPHAILEAARKVKELSGNVAVHAFLSPSTGRSRAAEAFLQAYRSDRPPLPPSGFKRSLAGGPIEVIAPHIAAGPRPVKREFKSYLFKRGIREVIYLGNPDSAEARADRDKSSKAALGWVALPTPTPDGLLNLVDTGGPFYLYGPEQDRLLEVVAARYGPAMPELALDQSVDPDVVDPGPVEDAGSEAQEPDQAGPERASPLARFIDRATPGPQMIILLGPILLLAAGAAAWGAGWLRVTKGLPVAYTRKTFHFVIFTMASLLQIGIGLSAVMLFGGLVSLLVLYAVARGDRFPFYEALARPADRPRRTLFILVPLATTALGGLLANLFFGTFAAVGYLVGGWGDAVGEPVGCAWGRHRYRVPSMGGVPAVRSLEGSAAVLLAGMIAATAGLTALGVEFGTAVAIGSLCGLIGAIVEAFSTHGTDNLTVQLAASGIAYFLLF